MTGAETFTFNARGRVLTRGGWRVLTLEDSAEETEDGDEANDGGAVPSLEIGSTVTATGARVTDNITKAPSSYTQASLIKRLETERIGRPSTYPETLKKIISTRHYVDEQKRKLAPTELGKLLAAFLTGHFSLADYAYTRNLEQHLDDIASGKTAYGQVLSDLDAKLNAELGAPQLTPKPRTTTTNGEGEQVPEQPGHPCPKCKEGIVRRPPGQEFYGCNRYKEGCTYRIGTRIAGKTLIENQATALIHKGRVGLMKGFTSKAGESFGASLRCEALTEWKTVFEFDIQDYDVGKS